MRDGKRRVRVSRGLVFVAVVVACLAGSAAYAAWAVIRERTATGPADPLARIDAVTSSRPFVAFQHVARDRNYARVAVSRVDAPSAAGRTITPLVCERVHFTGGVGLCLVPKRTLLRSTPVARIFDGDFKVRHEIALAGLITRARVSPDGRYGAATTFVAGHSYADDSFSTRTVLIDMKTAEVLGNVEQFRITRDGKTFRNRDFNFWGVTFARDSNRFYATLATSGKTYLVEGDVRGRTARVLHENVECPSLSPDNDRVAYKKRLGRRWRLHVLDLTTMEETPLAEVRSIDDQVEWLDDGRVLYGLAGDIWVVPADGSGSPETFLAEALSPAVVT